MVFMNKLPQFDCFSIQSNVEPVQLFVGLPFQYPIQYPFSLR